MKKLLLSLLLLLGAAAVVQAQEPVTMTASDFSDPTNQAYKVRTFKSDATGISYEMVTSTSSTNFQFNANRGCYFEIKDNPNGYVIDKVQIQNLTNGIGADDFTAMASDTALTPTGGNTNKSGGKNANLTGGTVVPFDEDTNSFRPQSTYFSFVFSRTKSGSVTFSAITITYKDLSDTRKELVLVYEPDDLIVHIGENFTAPVLKAYVNGKEEPAALSAVLYSTDNAELLDVDADGNMTFSRDKNDVVGAAVITASVDPDNTEYKAADEPATFTLHVVDPAEPHDDFELDQYDYGQGDAVVNVTANIVTLTFDRGKGGNAPIYNAADGGVRVYAKGTITVSVPEGFALVSTSSTNTGNTVTADYGTMEKENLWKAPAGEYRNSVTFTVNEKNEGKNDGWRVVKSFVVTYEHIETSVAGFEHNVHMYGNSAKLYYTIYINHHNDDQTYEVDFKIDGVSHKSTEHEVSVVEAPQGAMMRVSPATTTTHKATGTIDAENINTTGASKEHQIEVTIAHNGNVLSDQTYTPTETTDVTTGIEEVSAEA
ncbi:MAG: hypothetical protein K2F72_01360, partial [Muribaculaceae bacterium]|nr:hypothetical protein [Muribaculaceae bacterium]